MVEGLPHIKHPEQISEAYLAGKQHCSPFPHMSTYRDKKPLELVHADLCGPIRTTTPAGNRYFLLVVDDYSCFMWVALIKSKDEALEFFKKISIRV